MSSTPPLIPSGGTSALTRRTAGQEMEEPDYLSVPVVLLALPENLCHLSRKLILNGQLEQVESFWRFHSIGGGIDLRPVDAQHQPLLPLGCVLTLHIPTGTPPETGILLIPDHHHVHMARLQQGKGSAPSPQDHLSLSEREAKAAGQKALALFVGDVVTVLILPGGTSSSAEEATSEIHQGLDSYYSSLLPPPLPDMRIPQRPPPNLPAAAKPSAAEADFMLPQMDPQQVARRAAQPSGISGMEQTGLAALLENMLGSVAGMPEESGGRAGSVSAYVSASACKSEAGRVRAYDRLNQDDPLHRVTLRLVARNAGQMETPSADLMMTRVIRQEPTGEVLLEISGRAQYLLLPPVQEPPEVGDMLIFVRENQGEETESSPAPSSG